MSSRSLALALVLLSPFAGTSFVAAQDVGAADGSVEEVGSAASELQGRPNSANSAACGCSTAGSRTEAPYLALLAAVLVVGPFAMRRRPA